MASDEDSNNAATENTEVTEVAEDIALGECGFAVLGSSCIAIKRLAPDELGWQPVESRNHLLSLPFRHDYNFGRRPEVVAIRESGAVVKPEGRIPICRSPLPIRLP